MTNQVVVGCAEQRELSSFQVHRTNTHYTSNLPQLIYVHVCWCMLMTRVNLSNHNTQYIKQHMQIDAYANYTLAINAATSMVIH